MASAEDQSAGDRDAEAGGESPLSILRVVARLPPAPGGKERHAAMLTALQAAAGHRVHVDFVVGDPPSSPRVTSRRLRSVPMRGSVARAMAFGAQAAAAHATRRLPAIDVVHVHGDLGEIVAGAALRRLYDAPLVVTIHGRLARRAARARRVYRLPDAIAAVSDGIKDELVELGVPPDRVAVVPSGVDDPPVGLVWRPGNTTVMTVGLLEPVKGHDVVVDAVRRVRGTHHDVCLSIVGDGPLRGELAVAAADLGDDVELTGSVPHDDVLRRMADALAVVVASRRLPGKAEGTPTVMLEALTVGVPIVATRSAGWETPVAAGASIVVVPDDDADALARAIVDIAERPGHYRAISHANREVSRRFRWPVAAATLEAIYRRVLEATAHRRR